MSVQNIRSDIEKKDLYFGLDFSTQQVSICLSYQLFQKY